VAALLLVEDDPLLRQALVRDLADHGHVVRSAPNALEALRDVTASPPDLVVLDLGLPDLDGAHALRMIRGLRRDVPVIIASARDSDVDVVRLLHAGADDYLVKPFTSEQLHARVTAVLRRARPPQPEPTLCVGDLTIDPLRRQARLAGRELTLTRREFDLLAYLAARPDQVVSRRELLAEVWEQAYGQDQTIDVHLSLVRRKLGETAGTPRYLHTVRGVGVRLSAPADAGVPPP
jgi:DNA-binding response OmpR family regulator